MNLTFSFNNTPIYNGIEGNKNYPYIEMEGKYFFVPKDVFRYRIEKCVEIKKQEFETIKHEVEEKRNIYHAKYKHGSQTATVFHNGEKGFFCVVGGSLMFVSDRATNGLRDVRIEFSQADFDALLGQYKLKLILPKEGKSYTESVLDGTYRE